MYRYDLSVILPAYNEAANLPPLVFEIENAAPDAEVVIVDDGSTDGTWETIEHLIPLVESVTVRGVRLQANRGKAAALSAGFDAASGDRIVTIDADGQNDPADIPRLLDALDAGADCVFGHRSDRQDGIGKTLPSRIQTVLAKLTGPDINDFGCGIAAYERTVIDDIGPLYGDRHRYIAAAAHRHGHTVTEVTVNHRPRENGSSKFGAERLLRGFVDLWYWVVRNRFGDRPMHWLGGAGVLFMGTGVAIGFVSVIQKYAFGVALAPRVPRLVLLSLLILFGFLLFAVGYLAELLTRLEYRETAPYRVRETVGIERSASHAVGAVGREKDSARSDDPRGKVVPAEY